MLIKPNDVILFQGDSVTDCCRSKEALVDFGGLGTGYVLMIASRLLHHLRDYDLRVYNRGISGNRVRDLEKRWRVDCIDLQPTVVSILIGINDVWRRYDSNDPTELSAFERSYRQILSQVQTKLNAKILLLESFVTPYPADRKAWREDLDPKLEAVRRLAREFDAALVPLDSLFAEAYAAKPDAYYTRDGVHPTPAGHALIAQAWLEAAGFAQESFV